jgi:CHASE3 domain sensor protein
MNSVAVEVLKSASTFVLVALLCLTASTFVLVAMPDLTASTFALVAIVLQYKVKVTNA